jgi:anti-sigma factor RsiW
MKTSNSCHNVIISLSAFYDGELSAEQARRVEAHLSACAACRVRAEEFVAVSERLKAHPHIVPSSDFDARVVAAALAQAQRVTWMDKLEAWLARPLLRLGVSLALALMLSAATAWTANRIAPASISSQPSVARVDLDRLEKFYAGVWSRQGLDVPETPAPTPLRRMKGDSSWEKDLSSRLSQRFWC